MRILLGECVPWPIHRLFANHTCKSVQARGWSGIRNGDLLRRAEGAFELFITSDQNIRYQQNMLGRRIAILELSTNDLRRIEAARSFIESAIEEMRMDEFKLSPAFRLK
ncbi:MAG: hypothetical protein ACT4OT_16745 [Acidobacteriota bacterium]